MYPPQTHTVPILQSCLSLLIFKSMFKRVSHCIPVVSILYFDSINTFHYSPFLCYLPTHIFNAFQYISLYLLPSQTIFMILLMLYPSLFLSVLSWVPLSSSTVTNMFYNWVCIWSCLFSRVCLSFGSIFHVWEKNMWSLSFWAWFA
jgi:hypothetical protein